MPARISVALAPADNHTPTPVPPPHTGPAVSAALLGALRDNGAPDLAETLHTPRSGPPQEPDGSRTVRPKAFTVTPLLDENHQLANATSQHLRFAVSVLADPATATVLGALSRTSTIRIARCTYQVAAITIDALLSYPELLAAARPATTWNLRLVTPVGFGTARQEGARRTRPLPEPEWVFANLYTRWQALSGGTPLPDGLPEAITGHLEIADFQLTMAEHLVKAGQPTRRGSTGRITYQVAEPHRVPALVLAGLDALITFATYAGLGDRTAVGMGHIHLTPPVQPGYGCETTVPVAQRPNRP